MKKNVVILQKPPSKVFKIDKANITDFAVIREIAFATWPDTYGKILSAEQLTFMLEKFYAIDSLIESSKKNQDFYLLKDIEDAVGFIAIEHFYEQKKVTRLHKLYLLPSIQGRNAGRFIMDFIDGKARENQSKIISLNVNKYNKAVGFYQKIGFEIISEEIINIGFGYVMDDFRMEKKMSF